MNFNNITHTGNNHRGYTLLFAVITATLVLGVAVFILSVSKKQFELSVAARESLYSLYAADSGIECVVLKISTGIATSTPLTINCNGTPFNGTFTNNVVASSNSVFTGLGFIDSYFSSYTDPINIPLPTGCAKIQIYAGYRSNGSDPISTLVVDSRGYNNCNPDGTAKIGSRTVERALRLGILGL